MVGVFGVLAYSVQQRIRDFGVRRALGASSGDVMRLVLGHAIKVVGAGAMIGLVLAAATGRIISTMLFGVQPLDAVTFGLVIAVMAMTAIVAIAGPAWRAARVDPATALRHK
jgi:putative ABC transport system permease protein